ncbi:hypothetical protein [Amycolatopsis arida]|nr:hypothetical protein [Amycolatopsis arida]
MEPCESLDTTAEWIERVPVTADTPNDTASVSPLTALWRLVHDAA